LVAAAGRVNLERSRRRRFLSTGSKERPVIRRLHPASSPGHHPPTPPQLVWVTARQRRRSGASRTGKPGPKNRVKDEAPPLARRRVGSGLSGFVALSVLACGGGVSFRFCCTCGARCRSGSLWGLFVSGTCGVPLAVRVLFGVVSLLCAERVVASAPCAGADLRGSSAEHQRWTAVLLRRLDGSSRSSRSVVAAERSSVFRATLSSSLIVGAHSPGVVLPGQRASSTGVRLPPARRTGSTPYGMMFSPAQRARPNQGPTLPGATGWFHSSGAGDSNTRGRVNTFPAGDCHRRSELHCCRRPSPEGHFRGAAHIIAEQAPAPSVHTSAEHNTAAAHTTRRTIRGTRTHHQ